MPNADAVASRLEADRKALLDLSLRNPLLNYRPRARRLDIVGELPAQVYRSLVVERKRMAFLPAPEPAPEGADEAVEAPQSPPTVQTVQDDLKLQTELPGDALQPRLLSIYYAARTSLEEQGVNTLFLALGMLEWAEASDPARRLRAPLLLIPVTLERSNARDRFRLRSSDEDLETNLSLTEKLKADFRIALPDPADDEELEVEHYFDEVLKAVGDQSGWTIDRGAIVLGFFSFGKFLMYRDLDDETWPEPCKPSRHPVLCALLDHGFTESASRFSDDEPIDSHLTPQESFQVVDADSSQTLAILDVNQGRNLVIQGPPGTGKSQTIANLIAEAIGREKTVLFVAEKMAALEVVKQRLDRVGLGDICLELHSQKASKKAILEELRRTLELGKPKLAGNEEDLRILLLTRDRLNAYCQAVNSPIGGSGVSPYRIFGELLRLSEQSQGISPPPLEIPNLVSWSRIDLRRRQSLVEELQARLARVGVPAQHPFWGSRRTVLLPTENDRLRDLIAEAQRSTAALREAGAGLAQFLHVPPSNSRTEAETLVRTARRIDKATKLHGVDVCRDDWVTHRVEIQRLVEAGLALADLHKRYDAALLPEAWNEDLQQTRRDLNAFGRSWWRFLSSVYRRAERKIASCFRSGPPRNIDDQLAIVDAIITAQGHREVMRRSEALGALLFATRWQGERSNWEALANLGKWIMQLHLDVRAKRLPNEILAFLATEPNLEGVESLLTAVKTTLGVHRDAVQRLAAFLEFDAAARFRESVALEDRRFGEQSALFDLWASRLDTFSTLVGVNHLVERCRNEELGGVVAIAETWPEAGRHLVNTFDRQRYEALLNEAFRERPALAAFDGRGHEHGVHTFCDLDRQALRQNRARLASEHWQRLPRREGGGQLAILKREFEKKSRHLPVRTLLSRAGNAVRAIKPVFMMSPLSIAQYLAPGALEFDLVIFDEASQVKPVDALGAIVRGKQVVVVGDSRQLPPSNFFERLTGEEDEEDEATGDLESILGLFTAQGAPQRLLKWHYRSRHESLIAVSNHEFYDDRLVVFPSPDAGRKESGLVLRHLPDTVYDRGQSRTNPKEAEAVAQAAFDHARVQVTRPPDQRLTLGVAAFSMAQMDAIRDCIERLRSADPSCEEFFATTAVERFFVKNLENVQGDERDVVYISIGYGRTAEGDVAMSFGPLNSDGGERRLNVLITRARVRCEVFTNLTARDIDLNRTRARGVQALKTFLAFAEGEPIARSKASPPQTDVPFEDSLRSALAASGYELRPRVGSEEFAIDMAVLDPDRGGRYSLGITCDGPTYAEARSARDRDRLRAQVLEGLGWNLCRIWSTDWVRNPGGELKRVVAAIEKAKLPLALDSPAPGASPPSPASATSSNQETRPADAPAFERDLKARPEAVASLPRYELARLDGDPSLGDLHDAPADRLASLVVKVVQAESPVHVDEVFGRITEAAAVKRVSPQLRSALESACDRAIQRGALQRRGEFLWRNAMPTPLLRDRRELLASSRKTEFIAPEELALAIERVVADAFGMEPSAIAPQVCRLLGFARLSDEFRTRIDGLVRTLIEDHRLVSRGDQLMVANSKT